MSDEANEYYSACDTCRAKKFKCTKEHPECNSCVQLGLPCIYSRKVSRTPLTRRNLTSAENRIRDLETALTTLFPGIDLDTVLSAVELKGSSPLATEDTAQSKTTAPILTALDSHDQISTVESLPREADGFEWSENAVSLSDLSDGMAALSINPEGAGYLGATSSVVPLRALLGQETTIDQGPQGSQSLQVQSLFSNQIQIPINLPFSDSSEVTFIDAYFRHYHPTYPFLHEPSFRSQFQDKSLRPDSHSWTVLLNAVLALGAWCIGDDESVMDDFFYRKVARLTADESSIFESGNLALVQALLLLSNYAQKRNRPNTGWNYLGLAVRMALSLGLHKEFPNWEISLLQREMRRRVWWGLFIFDSGASITFGRPVLLPKSGIMDTSPVLNIHEDSLAVQTIYLPNEITDPTVYTALICQSHFHSATNSLHHRLISNPRPSPEELLSLNHKIEAWETSIPPYFQIHSPGMELHESFLFARYRLSWRSWNFKILLFRPIVLHWAARHSRIDASSSASFDTEDELQCQYNCIYSARATISSISEFLAKGIVSRLSTWYLLYFLFQAGLVPLICLMAEPTHPDSMDWLNDILTTKDLLYRTATTNRLAMRCLNIFERFVPSAEADPMGAGSWDAAEFLNEEMLGDRMESMDFWDWANNEVEWTL